MKSSADYADFTDCNSSVETRFLTSMGRDGGTAEMFCHVGQSFHVYLSTLNAAAKIAL